MGKSFFLNILKSIFISLEFFATVVFFILYFAKEIEFDKTGFFLFHDHEIVKWITLTFPLALFFGSLKFQKVLLQPEDNNKVLYNWPEYENYKVTTYIGIIFCLLPILSTFISVASLYVSHYEVKRILQK